MPMYEYRCDSCGKVCERYSAGKAGTGDAGRCPTCGVGNLTKIFSTFASTCCGGSGESTPAAGGCGGGSGHFS